VPPHLLTDDACGCLAGCVVVVDSDDLAPPL